MIKITFNKHVGLLNTENNQVTFYDIVYKDILVAKHELPYDLEEMRKLEIENKIFNEQINNILLKE